MCAEIISAIAYGVFFASVPTTAYILILVAVMATHHAKAALLDHIDARRRRRMRNRSR